MTRATLNLRAHFQFVHIISNIAASYFFEVEHDVEPNEQQYHSEEALPCALTTTAEAIIMTNNV